MKTDPTNKDEEWKIFVHNSMDFPEEFATWKVNFVENHGYLVTQRRKVIMGLACTGATNT